MDIIADFSGYLDAKYALPRQIENASELRIAKKYRELDKRIGDLRSETMKYTFVDSKSGAVKTKDDPRLAEIQQQIQAEEARLQKLRGVADQIGEILENRQVESIHVLQEKKSEAANIINSKPVEAWILLKQMRGEGKVRPEEIRTSWLPSDITQVPEYKAKEDEFRHQIEAAKAELASINSALGELAALVSEATGL